MLTLKSRRSGIRHLAHDGRIVVGGAAFCDLKVAGCPSQAVLVIACYDQGWMAHDVQAQEVKKNGQKPAQSILIENGDLWQIGSDEFLCSVTGESPDSGLPVALESECLVKISGHQGLPICHRFEKAVTIIGNALYCDVTFEEPRLQPQHYLIANVGGTWFLHSLVDSGGHDGWGGFFRVTNGESFQVGHTQLEFQVTVKEPKSAAVSPVVETPKSVPAAAAVTFKVPEADESDAIGRSIADIARIPSADAEAGLREAAQMAGSVANVGTDPNAFVQTSHDPHPGGGQDPVVLRTAQDILNKIKALHLRQGHQDSSLSGRIRRARLWWELRSVESEFAANARIRAFNKLGTLLEQDPEDRTLLLTFVRMCDVAGFDNICFHALRLMALRDPNDRVVTRALARICSHLGQSEPTYFAKAVRYWRDAQKQSPEERPAIESTIRDILVNQTTKRYERR